MRTHVKKKKYQAHVRDMTLADNINRPDGNWTSYFKGACEENTHRDVLEGTKGKAGRRGRKRKNVNAEI